VGNCYERLRLLPVAGFVFLKVKTFSMDSKQVWGAIVLLGFAGFLYWATTVTPTNSNETNTVSGTGPAMEQPVQAQENTSPSANAATKCDTEAKYWFDYYNKQSYSGQAQSYKYRYDQQTGGCYLLWSWQLYYGENNVSTAYNLYDVFRKSPQGSSAAGFPVILASVQTSSHLGLLECNFIGLKCSSVAEFLTLAEPYLGD